MELKLHPPQSVAVHPNNVLIVLYGIETMSSDRVTSAALVLIVLYGIETEYWKTTKLLDFSLNRTLWN